MVGPAGSLEDREERQEGAGARTYRAVGTTAACVAWSLWTRAWTGWEALVGRCLIGAGWGLKYGGQGEGGNGAWW